MIENSGDVQITQVLDDLVANQISALVAVCRKRVEFWWFELNRFASCVYCLLKCVETGGFYSYKIIYNAGEPLDRLLPHIPQAVMQSLLEGLTLRDRHARQEISLPGLRVATGRLPGHLDRLLPKTFRDPPHSRTAQPTP